MTKLRRHRLALEEKGRHEQASSEIEKAQEKRFGEESKHGKVDHEASKVEEHGQKKAKSSTSTRTKENVATSRRWPPKGGSLCTPFTKDTSAEERGRRVMNRREEQTNGFAE